eukprot:COSAG02_NODE_4577_length_5201_cov_1.571737_1_plen_59_part_10
MREYPHSAHHTPAHNAEHTASGDRNVPSLVLQCKAHLNSFVPLNECLALVSRELGLVSS